MKDAINLTANDILDILNIEADVIIYSTEDLFTQIAEIVKPAQALVNTYTFTSIEDVIKQIRNIATPAMSFAEFKALQTAVLTNEETIKALISKKTIPQLRQIFYFYATDTKAQLVKNSYDNILSSFNLSGGVQYSPFEGQTYRGQLIKLLDAQTEEVYNRHTAKKTEEREEREAFLSKAYANPETVEEFKAFIAKNGVPALTVEQRAAFDELQADKTRETRAYYEKPNNVVKEVTTPAGLTMEIKKSRHTKKNIDLYVVVISERVEREVYTELNNRAKKLNGYYSSFRGGGAIPGFTFESEKEALLFTQVKDGDVDTTELKQESEQERTAQRAETLTEKAQAIEEKATESLNRDRKDNTHRRARMASHAEQTALNNIAFAQTMQQIAEGMQSGEIKYLNKLQNISELETLYRIIVQAKNRHQNQANISYRDYVLTIETGNYIIYPYPSVWKSNVIPALQKLSNTPGKKLAAARLLNRIMGDDKTKESFTISGTHTIEDYETVLCTPTKGIFDHYEAQRYKDDLLTYKRIQRLNLISPAELRAAGRELIKVMISDKISPEQRKIQEIREIERKFVAAKIDGFFPTPKTLAAEVVELANIQEGNTICEPSAGLGHIADIIAQKHPDNDLTCIECNYSLCEALNIKGHGAENNDFLQHTEKYDRIVMNPPFSNGQDITHVLHAYSLLNEGGRLVAIMAGNKEKQDNKTREFMNLVSNEGYYITNPSGSFLSAFRPTGVNTITVILNK